MFTIPGGRRLPDVDVDVDVDVDGRRNGRANADVVSSLFLSTRRGGARVEIQSGVPIIAENRIPSWRTVRGGCARGC